MFRCETFFSVFDEMFIKVPWFRKTSPVLKISGRASALRHYSSLLDNILNMPVLITDQ